MAIARPHPRQDERLRALYSYEILDTDREKDFDDVVKLAAATCGTAISVVNFIDADRQWFKAETGLGVRETPLETSICSHIILEEEFVEIRDTLEDPRMVDNPLCCDEPGLRFYAGALLRTDAGLPIGTLCVLDHEPRELTALQRDTLRVLARQLMAQLEMRKTLKRATLLRQEVDHRVKNSLQSLSSLIQIANRRARSDETKTALTTIDSRVQAVAKLHQELYRTNAGPVVELDRYVKNLGAHFREIAPQDVTLDVTCDALTVTSAEAVAVGTLINEFIANSFKHAFPGDRAGHVRVTIEGGPGNLVQILCADDGIGIPKEIDASRGGLGMQIAAVISSELRGELEVRSDENGLSVGLDFTSEAPEGTGAAHALL
ncbi:GAF domain-containing protein [Aquicoccus sp. SCR17]|nr:GAF domain-containing protein [Carideicomes alvinocaridis]